MSLLPLELQVLILEYIKNVPDLISIITVEPRARPLIQETVTAINGPVNMSLLSLYAGTTVSLCRLRTINDWLHVSDIKSILFLGLFPHLHTFYLNLPLRPERFIIPLLASYYTQHRSFKALTLRCRNINQRYDFLFYRPNSLYLDPSGIDSISRNDQRQSEIKTFLFQLNDILEATEILLDNSEDYPLEGPSTVILVRQDINYSNYLDLENIMDKASKIHLTLVSTLNSDQTRSFNEGFSRGLEQHLLTIGLDNLTAFSNITIFNVPFGLNLLERITEGLSNLELIGLLGMTFNEGERRHVIRVLDRHHDLRINVFIADDPERTYLPLHPRITFTRGGSYQTETYPPPLGEEDQGRLSHQMT